MEWKKKQTNKVKIILKVHNYWLERKRESKTHDQGTLSSQKNVSSHLKGLQNPLGEFLLTLLFSLSWSTETNATTRITSSRKKVIFPPLPLQNQSLRSCRISNPKRVFKVAPGSVNSKKSSLVNRLRSNHYPSYKSELILCHISIQTSDFCLYLCFPYRVLVISSSSHKGEKLDSIKLETIFSTLANLTLIIFFQKCWKKI
jgi:hypothetical protein